MVLSGENLYTIANRYGVTAKDIRKWNGLGSNRVAKGKRLRLYVDNGGVAFASATKTPVKSTTVTAKSTATTTKKSLPPLQNRSLPLIKILSLIRLNREIRFIRFPRNYPGVTASSLQKVNGCQSGYPSGSSTEDTGRMIISGINSSLTLFFRFLRALEKDVNDFLFLCIRKKKQSYGFIG